jgi:3-oxoacyl-[acyl-carrier protein] reductase
MTTELEGQVALVTGGTLNIGQAAAVRLAQAGATVVVNGRNEEQGLEAVDLVQREAGSEAFFENADLLVPSAVEAMVERVVARHGRVDILVASGAGASPDSLPFKFFHEMEVEDFDTYIRSHWLSRVYAIRAVLPQMRLQNGGKIINVTTDAGREPTVGESFIGGAAAGLMQMSKVLAREFGRWGIRVNNVSVSVVPDAPVRWPRKNAEKEGEKGPESGVGPRLHSRMMFEVSRWQVADMVVHFAGGGGDAITGQTVSVNGGISFPG